MLFQCECILCLYTSLYLYFKATHIAIFISYIQKQTKNEYEADCPKQNNTTKKKQNVQKICNMICMVVIISTGKLLVCVWVGGQYRKLLSATLITQQKYLVLGYIQSVLIKL